MSWPIYKEGDYVFAKMRRSRYSSLETLWPAVVKSILVSRGINFYTVELYGNKGTMEYVSVLDLRKPTEAIMEWGSIIDYELRAAIVQLRRDMGPLLPPPRRGRFQTIMQNYLNVMYQMADAVGLRNVWRSCIDWTSYTMRLLGLMGNRLQDFTHRMLGLDEDF